MALVSIPHGIVLKIILGGVLIGNNVKIIIVISG
jgi:hypothetical protein